MLKLKRLTFDNGYGDIFDFTQTKMLYQENDLMSQEWKYNKSEYASGAVAVTDFFKDDRTYNLTVHLWCEDSEEEYRAEIDRLSAAADKNILNMTYGRLYLNNAYLLCRITGIEHLDWQTQSFQHKIKLSILAEHPMWIVEKTLLLSTGENVGGKSYPLNYPYHYGARATLNAIRNPHYSSSNFKIVFYGYAVNPKLTIGGIDYGFNNLTLSSNEYAVYDTFNREMYKVSDSVRTNLFNSRMTRSGNAYRPLSVGDNSLNWSKTFKAALTIYSERSLPQWV